MYLFSIFKQVLVYGFSSIFARLLNFLLIPLYTYYFLPQEYAIISDFYSIMAFFSVLLAFSIDSFYFRVQTETPIQQVELELEISGAEQKKIVPASDFFFNQCMSFLVLINTAFLTITLLNAQTLAEYLDYPSQKNWVILCVLILFFDAFSVLPLAALRSEKKAWRFGLINTSMIFLNIGCNLLYFLYLKPQYNLNIESASVVFAINLMASIFRFLLLLPNFYNYTPEFNWVFWGKMIPYTAPLVLVGIGGMINEVIDRQMLKYLLLANHSKEEALYQVGIYSAVYKFSIFITLINQAFRYAVEPFLLRLYNGTDFQKDLHGSRLGTIKLQIQLMNIYVGILLFSFLGLSFFSDFLKHIFLSNPAYWEGLKILPILLLAQVFLGIYYQQSIWYRLAMATQIGAHISWIGVLITIIINFIFIPTYGYWASAWGTLICYFSMLVLSYFWSQRYLAIPYMLKKIAYYFAVALYFYYIVQHAGFLEYFFGDDLMAQIGGRIFFLSLYAWIIFRLEFYKIKIPNEIKK